MVSDDVIFELITFSKFKEVLLSLLSLHKQNIQTFKDLPVNVMLHPFDVLVEFEIFLECSLVHLFGIKSLLCQFEIFNNTLWLILQSRLHKHLKEDFFVTLVLT